MTSPAERETLFAAALEQAPEGCVLLEALRDERSAIIDFTCVYANSTATRLLQRPHATLLGARLLQVLPGAREQPLLFPRLVRVAETGQGDTAELYYDADGIHRWFRTTVARVGDGVVIFFSDISVRKLAEERQRLLDATSALLASALDYQATLNQLAQLLVPAVADWCAIDMLDEQGRLRRLAVAHVDSEHARRVTALAERYPRALDAPAGVGAVVRTGRPELYPRVPDAILAARAGDAEHLEALRSFGVRSAMIVPLAARGRTLGALTLVTATSGRCYDTADLAFAEALAARAALAVDNARLLRAREAAAARYRGLFEGVTDAVLVADAEGRFIEANPAATELLGYTREELLQRRVGDLAVDPAHSRATFARLQQTGFLAVEGLLRRKDGTVVPVEGRQTRVDLPTGPVYLAVWRDISERRRAEETRARLAAIVESSADAIFAKTLDGIITSWNPAAARLYGYTAEEIIGQSVSRLVPPDRAAELAEIMARLQRGERIENLETQRIAKDGRRIAVSLSISPVRDDDGRIIGAATIARDITGRLHAEQERERLVARQLRRGEQLRQLAAAALRLNTTAELRALLQEITDQARAIIGAHHAATSFSSDQNWAQALTATANSDPVSDWRVDDLQPRSFVLARLVGETNRPLRLTRAELEEHPPWRSSSENPARQRPPRGWLAAPLVGRDGRNLGLIQVADKIDGEFDEDDEAILVQLAQMAANAIENHRAYEAQQRATAQAQAALHERDALLAIVTHDLRNPLTTIKGYAQLLRRQTPEVARACEAILAQTAVLERLVSDLEDASRLDIGRLELQRRAVDLVAEARAVVERTQAQTSRHALRLAAPDGPLIGWWDRERLEQVFTNLLTNAIKYSPDGGEVLVRIEERGSSAQVSVQDQGVGIPVEAQPRIFDRFYRAAGGGQVRGLGLGLYITRGIIEAHGGRIWVESTPGQGATFYFTLSLRNADQTSAA